MSCSGIGGEVVLRFEDEMTVRCATATTGLTYAHSWPALTNVDILIIVLALDQYQRGENALDPA